MSANIPQHILDAIRQVAEYTRQSGYGEVLISQTGDTSFRSAKPKEEYNPRRVVLVTAVELVSLSIIMLGGIIIMGLRVFTSHINLEFGWWLVLVGAIFLFGTTITNSASAILRQPRRLGTLQDSLFIAFGLAALSKSQSPILFGFFCVAGFLCFVFWVWESFGRKPQQKEH